MSSQNVTFDVDIRDGLGRFAAHCKEAAQKSADEAAEEGARVARAFAPRKTDRLASTISVRPVYVMESGNTLSGMAEFKVGTSYWREQEYGARPHYIPRAGGDPMRMKFYWAKAGRDWKPGRNYIHHPGNLPHSFMLAGYEAAKRELRAAVRRNY